jgi:hypothetical protein
MVRLLRACPAVLAVLLLLAAVQPLSAQAVIVAPSAYCPAPVVSYYAPPVVSAYVAPTVSYYAAPTVSYYAAPPVRYYAPPTVSYYAPAPAVSYYAPTPAVTTYYRYGLFGRRVAATSYYYP